MSGNPTGARDSAPRVSVVTPIYNTARYLRECIESVLAQTLGDFEYVLVDNRSDDGSVDIAREFAARDRRIRLIEADRHVPQLPNFNRAVGSIAPGSRYCKMVLADDRLFPECLERLVAVAERDDGVAMVGSYYLQGESVRGGGLPSEREIFEGREVGRRQLLEGKFFVGTPSTVLYRADLVRERVPLFDPDALHADTELAYEILATARFGFVHQVLSFLRVDDASISGGIRDLAPEGLDKLIVVMRYGRRYLDENEFRDCLRRHERRYYRAYAESFLGGGGRAAIERHRRGHARAGYRPSRLRFALEVGRGVARRALSPGWWLARVRGGA